MGVGTGRKSSAKQKMKVLVTLRIRTKGTGACACAIQLPAPVSRILLRCGLVLSAASTCEMLSTNPMSFFMRAREKEKEQYRCFMMLTTLICLIHPPNHHHARHRPETWRARGASWIGELVGGSRSVRRMGELKKEEKRREGNQDSASKASRYVASHHTCA